MLHRACLDAATWLTPNCCIALRRHGGPEDVSARPCNVDYANSGSGRFAWIRKMKA
jgi:hypothetical protein